MRAPLGLIVGAGLLFWTEPAASFGLRTHLYIAEQVYADIAHDCDLDLRGRIATVPQPVCGFIQTNKGAFLAGAIGPDAFPDLLVGQSFVHPGTENGRQAADWFARLLAEAKDPAEVAFAFGEMVHAAADIFAHSYVNNYAGAVFELTAKRAKDVEKRHFKLEKYIDQRLPYEPNLDELVVPSGLLVRTMVRTSYVPVGLSIQSTEHGDLVLAIVRALADPSRTAKRLVKKEMKKRAMATAPGLHMMAMWKFLALADASRLSSVCFEIDTVRATRDAFRAYVEVETAARAIAEDSSAPPDRASIPAPPTSLGRVYKKPARDECLADLARAARGIEGGRGDADLALEAALEIKRGVLRTESAKLDEVVAEARKQDWSDEALNRREAWFKDLGKDRHGRDLQRRLARSHKVYADWATVREEARALNRFASLWATDTRLAIEAYMQASLTSAKVMVSNSQPVPPQAHERKSASRPYAQWLDCYLSVTRGQPAESAKAACDRMEALGTDMSLVKASALASVGNRPRNLLFAILGFEKWLTELAYGTLIRAAKFGAPDLGELIESIYEPRRIGRAELDHSFNEARSRQLHFACVSDFIDADLRLIPPLPDEEASETLDGVTGGAPCLRSDGKDIARSGPYFDPAKFVTLTHSITLAKLSLLDNAALEKLADEMLPGDHPPVAFEPSVTSGHYSIIVETARSLDGSHQWQGYSMPLPRAGIKPVEVQMMGAGYPLPADLAGRQIRADPRAEPRNGFPFYRTPELREHVFAKLFPEPFEGEILRRAEFRAPLYSVRPCTHDPFRRAHVGNDYKERCAVTPLPRADARVSP